MEKLSEIDHLIAIHELDRDYCEAYKKFFSSCLPLFRVFINEKKQRP